jgi:mycofactocin system glycosyltransferase
MNSFVRDPTWCRLGDGSWVAGGSPRRLWRLGAGGRRVADALDDGAPLPAGHEQLTRRLVDAGALHPRPQAPTAALAIAVVIPTRHPDQANLAALTAALRAEVGAHSTIVIVDDASQPPVTAPAGAQVIRNDVNLGPAGARNRGVRHTDSDVVVFVDDDVIAEPGWLAPLLGLLNDEAVVAVAPRVRGPQVNRQAPWRERAEQVRSPLDLGAQASLVHRGGRVPYVPAAALVVRRTAWDAVGGFDTALRFGEDVDVVWRLAAAGGQVRYEPASVVRHRTRPTWSGWLTQRFHYGTSAAALAQRHPGALAVVRLPRRQWVGAVAALIPRPVTMVAAAVMLVWSGRDLTRLLHAKELPDAGRWATRWSAQAHTAGVRQVADALWRTWWPVSLAAALVNRHARHGVMVALAITVWGDMRWWRATPALDPVRVTLAARLDAAAYGAGVWWGAWRRRVWEPVLPHCTTDAAEG